LESGLTTNPQIWLHWPIRLDFIVEYETFTPDENIGPGSISFANREKISKALASQGKFSYNISYIFR